MNEDLLAALAFAERYAGESGMTLDEFASFAGERREVRRCACGDDSCGGWQMASPEFREPWETPVFSLADLARVAVSAQ